MNLKVNNTSANTSTNFQTNNSKFSVEQNDSTALDENILFQLIDQLINLLLGELSSELKMIILFGSYSRGEAKENSDIDIMALFDSVDYSKWKTGRSIANSVGAEHGKIIDFQISTIDNFETNSSPFFREIRRTCQIIYLAE